MKSSTMSTTKKLFQLSALTLSLALVGCGGGSGSVDSVKPPPCTGANCGSGGNGETGGEGGTGGNPNNSIESIKISDIIVYNSKHEPTRTITKAGASAEVTVNDKDGNGIPNALVTFEGEGVAFGSSNGAVVTNGNGKATISVRPLSIDDTGSYTMKATVSYDGETATSSDYFYSLQALDIILDEIEVANSDLETGASTLVTLVTKDQMASSTDDKTINDVTVEFSTGCGTFDNPSVVSSNKGNVRTTYKSIDENGDLCTGKQTIKASTPNGSADPISVDVDIADIEPTSIVYSTPDGLVLGSKSSGSASTSQIEFMIFSNGTPASNQQVKIDLIRAPYDFSFYSNGNRDTKVVTSDASGKISITVYPGDVPGPVQLKATLVNDEDIFALSKRLAVAVGRPLQKGFNLAVGRQVLVNNKLVSTTITATVNDRQGNAVPEGTPVSFISEGGYVTPSCSTDNVGQCTVTFTSQYPRPAYGRVSVLAFVEGEKDYVDINGNNTYEAGIDKLSHNIGILYRDDNENKQYDSQLGEFQYSRENEGSDECANPTFTQPNRVFTCNDELDVILRRQIIMGFADSTPTIINTEFHKNKNTISFDMYGNSTLTLPMPSATEVEIKSEDRTNDGIDCKSELSSGFETVPGPIDLKQVPLTLDGQIIENNFLDHPVVKYEVDVANCSVGDKIELVVTTPEETVFKMRLNTLLD